jgi:hypothetical protein
MNQTAIALATETGYKIYYIYPTGNTFNNQERIKKGDLPSCYRGGTGIPEVTL